MIFVRKVKLDPDNPLIIAADKMEPKIRQAFLQAINAVKDQIEIDQFTKAIEEGDSSRVMDILDISNRLSGALQGKGIPASDPTVIQTLNETFQAGAKAGLLNLPENVGVNIGFNVMNPKSVEFLHNYTFDLIQQVSQDTRDSVQDVVTRAFQEGGHPFEQARKIKQFIGLTTTQEQAISNYRSALESGGTSDLQNALGRALRDGRYDKSLLKAIQNQTSLPQDKIDSMVERYRQKMLQYRARNIARTESIRASNRGQNALWHQAIDQGLLNDDVEREWEVSGDSDTCDICSDLDGETAGIDEEFDDGILEPPDPHPSCRCTVKLVASTMKRAA